MALGQRTELVARLGFAFFSFGSASRSVYGPVEIASDADGNFYVADSDNHPIRKITHAGEVTTIAGSPRVSGFNDGRGSAARFNYPTGVALDHSGNLYVTDTLNHSIYGILNFGRIQSGYDGALFKINKDGSGYVVLHQFSALGDGSYRPGRVIVGSDGSLYGTTGFGGNRGGTVFAINKDGVNYRVIYKFSGLGAAWQFPGDIIEVALHLSPIMASLHITETYDQSFTSRDEGTRASRDHR